MPKDQKVHKDRTQYLNTQQTETYRQQLAKEQRILAAKTKADIQKLEPYFHTENNTLALVKKNPEQKNTDAVKFEHPVEQLGQVEYEYCQKCHRDRKFCPHKNVERLDKRRDELRFPLTSTQTYGWRKPIDTSNWGYGMKTTFQIMTTQFRQSNKTTK